METLTTLRGKIAQVLADNDMVFWTQNHIENEIVDAIREVSESCSLDLIKNLLDVEVFVGNGTTHLFEPNAWDNIVRIISLEVQESNGSYGKPFKYVSPKILKEIKYAQDDADQDSTSTRIFCYDANDAGYPKYLNVYPTPASARNLRLTYLVRPVEEGTLDIPDNMMRCVKDLALSRLWAFKAKDLELSAFHRGQYQNYLALLNAKHENEHGLSAATIVHHSGYFR